jgi:hypothetical protein
MRRSLGLAAVAALALFLASQPAWAQRPELEHPIFGHSQMGGTGFITTPHAMVSPATLYGTVTLVVPRKVEGAELLRWIQQNGTVGLTLGSWLELGASMNELDSYSGFAKLQVLQQTDLYPAIAFGVMNVNTTERGRYTANDYFYRGKDDLRDLSKTASYYGVATYVAGPGGERFPSWVVFSGGFGYGPIFSKENPAFEDQGSGGAFGAIALDFQVEDNAFLRFVFEYDGFDSNAAVVAWLDGLEVTAGIVAIDESDPPDPLLPGLVTDVTREHGWLFYNQAKLYISIALEGRALARLPWTWRGGE